MLRCQSRWSGASKVRTPTVGEVVTSAVWKLESSTTKTSWAASSYSSVTGRPMLPARATSSPWARRTATVSMAVVVLPLEPVTATTCRSAKSSMNSAVGVVTTAPSRLASTRRSSKRETPGECTTKSNRVSANTAGERTFRSARSAPRALGPGPPEAGRPPARSSRTTISEQLGPMRRAKLWPSMPAPNTATRLPESAATPPIRGTLRWYTGVPRIRSALDRDRSHDRQDDTGLSPDMRAFRTDHLRRVGAATVLGRNWGLPAEQG